MKEEKIVLQFKSDKFKKLLARIGDLGKINPMVKIKIDKDNILMYSRAGTNTVIQAFKSAIYDTSEFITINDDFEKCALIQEESLDFIVLECATFINNCTIMLKDDSDIMCKLTIDPIYGYARKMTLSNGIVELNFVSGDYTLIKNITKEEIETKFDVELADFSFSMVAEKLNDIRKFSVINKSETINIKVKKGKVTFSETKWKMVVAEVDYDDCQYVLNKKLLKSIEKEENITLYMFPTYILIKQNNVNIIIGFEIDEFN